MRKGLERDMAKSSRTLTGAAKNLYFERVLEAEAEMNDAARERLLARLAADVALVSLKAARSRKPATANKKTGFGADCSDQVKASRTAEVIGSDSVGPATGIADAMAISVFDPYSPNVIVVIRTQGREAVLAELDGIADVDCLLLLAREQQLGIEPGLSCADDIRLAIVAAAERRIANRRAAAS